MPLETLQSEPKMYKLCSLSLFYFPRVCQTQHTYFSVAESLFVRNFCLSNGVFCQEIMRLAVGSGLLRAPNGLLRVVLNIITFTDKSKCLIITQYLKIKGCSDSVKQLVTCFLPGGPDDNLIEGGGSKFVCKPGARNITIIFHPLLR